MHDATSPPAESWPVVVVGAGAAGLMAAISAAECGCRTLLVEKNRKPGVKILMSGGTRCNITHATDNRGIVEAFGPPGKFLHSSLAALSVEDTVALFEAEGVATKVEETGKIFPVSNRATDVLEALLARLRRSGAELALDEPVVEVSPAVGAAADPSNPSPLRERLGEGEAFPANAAGFELVTARRRLHARTLIITSGGQSYPGCGTTGDGYRWAAHFGHTIVPPRPALVPLTVEAPWVRALAGVTIPNVALQVIEPADRPPHQGQVAPAEKFHPLATRRGSLLFTHFGLSGPVALDVSRVVSGHAQPGRLALVIDFLPQDSSAQLEEMLNSEAATAGKKSLAAVLPDALPRRLVDSLLALAEIPNQRRLAETSRRVRQQVVGLVKRLMLPISSTMGFKKAEVTAGGISLDEVNSSTLESKLAANLYLAGEVLDLDGPIGGYNFQAAWSTGWLAGKCASRHAMQAEIL